MQKQDKRRHPTQAASDDAVHPVPPSTANVPANANNRPDASAPAPARPKVRMQRRPFSDN